MIQILAIFILFFSGLLAIVCNKKSIAFSGCLIATVLSFINFIIQKTAAVYNIDFFNIDLLSLKFSFESLEILLCSVIWGILCCIYFEHRIENKNDPKKGKMFGLINLGASCFGLTIAATNFFLLFLCLEVGNIIITILLSSEKINSQQIQKVFLFNKISSLLFLIATSLIAITWHIFNFNDIATISNNQTKITLPAILLLLAAMSKGAQLPFPNWFLTLNKTNVFVSIFIHCSSTAISIVLLYKCCFIFELWPPIKTIMICIGSITFFFASCAAFFYHNIKKIISCLTIAPIGTIIAIYGFEEHSLGLLCCIYFLTSQALLFLSFFYITYAMSNEQNILNMGGIAKLIPNITLIVWIAFAISVNLPLLLFFSPKDFLIMLLYNEKNYNIALFYIFSNIFYIMAILKTIFVTLYGNQFGYNKLINKNEATLSRVSQHKSTPLTAAWLLILVSIVCSSLAFFLYQNGKLNFESSQSYNYKINNIFEIYGITILQIFIACVVSILLVKKYKKPRTMITKFLSFIFRYDRLLNLLYKYIFIYYKSIEHYFRQFYNQIYIIFSKNKLQGFTSFILSPQRNFFSNHLVWLFFAALVFIVTIFVGTD